MNNTQRMCHERMVELVEHYRIEAVPGEHGWVISSPAFGIQVDAPWDALDKATESLKQLMGEEAQKVLDAGEFLPRDNAFDGDEARNGALVLYLETDFGNRFMARTSDTVRRNISMPAWMDLRLRKHNVDASRLFQDAAAAKLAELEHAGGGRREIRDMQDLEEMCPKGILDDYFAKRLRDMVSDSMGKGERRL